MLTEPSTPPAQTVCQEPNIETITVRAEQPPQTVWDIEYVTVREQNTIWIG